MKKAKVEIEPIQKASWIDKQTKDLLPSHAWAFRITPHNSPDNVITGTTNGTKQRAIQIANAFAQKFAKPADPYVRPGTPNSPNLGERFKFYDGFAKAKTA